MTIIDQDQTPLQLFIAAYGRRLRQAMIDSPGEYRGSYETIFPRMAAAIERGTFNKDQKTFRAVCKDLGIRHTYKAIKAFLAGNFDDLPERDAP